MNIKYDLNSIKINLYVCTRDMLKNVYCSIVYNSKRWGISQNQLYECACAKFLYYSYTCMCAKSLQLCMTLCDPMDCSPAGSSVHGILQAKSTGMGCCALFQAIFLTQGLNLRLLCPLCWQVGSLPLVPPGKLIHYIYYILQYMYWYYIPYII